MKGLMVRNKAIKGKDMWCWAHLEPILVHNSDTGFSKAVKLRVPCALPLSSPLICREPPPNILRKGHASTFLLFIC